MLATQTYLSITEIEKTTKLTSSIVYQSKNEQKLLNKTISEIDCTRADDTPGFKSEKLCWALMYYINSHDIVPLHNDVSKIRNLSHICDIRGRRSCVSQLV